MARRESGAARNTTQQSLKLPNQGKRPQGIKKGQKRTPLRRSARLSSSIEIYGTQDRISQQPFPSPVSDIKGIDRLQPSLAVLQSKPLKRKQETEQLIPPLPKRPRTSCPRPPAQTTFTPKAVRFPQHDVDSISYWTQTCRWPREYFDESGEMGHLLARETTPSDQKAREEKSAPYKDARYEALLATKGSFMDASDLGVDDKSKTLIRVLLEKEQPLPKDSLFRDDLFDSTCRKIRNRNETRVIRDISQLIVPSAEIFATYGANTLDCLIESTNEGWNNSIPLTKPRPQPDYSVGFRREAFTETQLQKLQPFVGELTDNSFFMATYYMYFPFFSSEVKCGATALDVADRQNTHSMTLAVRGVVELFRLVKREKELHREILAFSISHDHRSVRIYGHYPVIEGKRTTFYRHPIREFSFTELDGKEKWTAYKFTESVYDLWMPAHFKRLCSVIDAMPPDIHFELSEESELQFASSSGFYHGLESHHLSESVATDDDEPRLPEPQEVTPDTSITQASEQAKFKKPKKR